MLPEFLTATSQEDYPVKIKEELIKNLVGLFVLIGNKGLNPFTFRRIMTGNEIREKDRKSIKIDISGENGTRTFHISTTSVLNGGLLKPTADLIITVSVANNQNGLDQKTADQIIDALGWARKLINCPDVKLIITKDLAGKTLVID